MTLRSLTPVLPVLAAVAAGLLVVALRGRRQHPTDALWVIWAAVAGGQLALAGLSAEFLGQGAGGVTTAGLGGITAGALMISLLRWGNRPVDASVDEPTPGADAPAPPDSRPARDASTHDPRFSLSPVGRMMLLAVCLLATAVLLTWAGLGLVAGIGVLVLAGAGCAGYGLSFAAGIFLALSVASAGLVVVSRLLLSPLALVGHELPSMVVLAILLLPFVAPLGLPGTWRRAVRLVGTVDAAAFLVAGVAASAWWRLLDGLDDEEALSQLVRLGEDHLSHLLMFEATRESGTTLGHSTASLDVTTLFASYFPGSSIWQTAFGGLLSDGSMVEQYVASTLLLMGMLALGASAVATQFATRTGILAAIGVLMIGAIATRASLAMYELGFPGQLMAASFLVAALLLVTSRGIPVWLCTGSLVLLSAATYWTWSLVAPVLGAALVVVLGQVALHRWRPSRRLLVQVGAALAVLGLLALVVEKDRLVSILDELSLEGGVFRGIPLWLSFALLLALPLAWRAGRLSMPFPLTVLVLGVASIELLLMSWQMARVGTITYYTYKVEYLVLALGWAAGTLWLTAVTSRWESGLGKPARIGLLVLAIAVAAPLLSWPSDNYRGWLMARGVLGPDAGMVCAIRSAEHVPGGAIVLATGFGEPINDYLTTKAMDVSVDNNYSQTFWSALLNQPDPTTWPWRSTTRQLFLVSGPDAEDDRADEIVEAARTSGTSVTFAGSC